MKQKVVIFNEFSHVCPFFNAETDVNNGYGCEHGEEMEGCYCFRCPLGIEAEAEDYEDLNTDLDGLSKEELEEAEGNSEYLLVSIGDDASDDERLAMHNYERHINRYNKKWLDEHDIQNSLCS